MDLQEANQSLKLECALRELGFVEIDWMVYGHAGIFYVYPVGFTPQPVKTDDLLGFQLNDECSKSLVLGAPLLQTAKRALEYALDNHYIT